MKILFTGGGTGGHFYPVIAIIQALRDLENKENLLEADVYFVGDTIPDERFISDYSIHFKHLSSGKRRIYSSARNVLDIFKTVHATLKALLYLYKIYPDVVFGKGGYVSFPILFAARILNIPVMIHESDSVPGRVNKWAGKFARSIALSYPDAAEYFPQDKTVLTGNPIRREIINPVSEGARQYLELDDEVPVLLVLGGSQGAQKINYTFLEALPVLLNNYQVIHQVGEANVPEVESILEGAIGTHQYRRRYKYFGLLTDTAMKMSAGAANLVITRAGSTLYEVAAWGLPSIVIPISESNGDHQMKNAFYYARHGAAVVLEEGNLSANILIHELDRLFAHPAELEEMSKKAKTFGHTDAAEKIARELVSLAQHH